MIEKVRNAKTTKYRARIFHHGRQVIMATFDRKADADNWEREQKTAFAARNWSDPRRGDVLMSVVISEFLEERRSLVAQHTYDTDEANLRLHVPADMRALPIGAISKQKLQIHFNSLLRKRSRGTAKRIRDSFSVLFAYAVERDYIKHNVVADARLKRGDGTQNTDIAPFTDIEFATMLLSVREINPAYADIVEFLRETGLRWGEMKALRVRDVSASDSPGITVRRSKSDGYPEKQTKGRRVRRVPLVGSALDIAIKATEGKASVDFLFSSTEGAELNGSNFCRDINWATHARGHRLHDLRHTTATSWLRSGIDPKTLSVWLGHSTTQQTVNRYAHWMGSDSDLPAIQKAQAAWAARNDAGNNEDSKG